jgi:F-type H+-transporting ATPase subunit b
VDNIDWTLWLQAGNFVVLIVLLERLLYRPLQAVVDQRQARQEQAMERSRQLEEQTERQQQAYDARLAQVRNEAQQARTAVLAEAQRQQSQLLQQSHVQAAQVLAQVRHEVAGQLQQQSEQLPRLAARLGEAAAARLLGRPL